MDAPSFSTTIDRDHGPHGSGLRVMGTHEVKTSYSDYAGPRWDDIHPDNVAKVLSTLEEIHDAKVALESLPSEHRDRAKGWLLEHADNVEFSTEAQTILKAIEATR